MSSSLFLRSTLLHYFVFFSFVTGIHAHDSSLTSVANGLHFINVVIVNYVVKGGVELVEEVHDLMGRAGPRQLGEAHNVTVMKSHCQTAAISHLEFTSDVNSSNQPEVDGSVGEALSLCGSTLAKVISNRLW